MTLFDAAGYKQTTEEQWDSVAEHWNAWGSLLDRWLRDEHYTAASPNQTSGQGP